MLRQQDSGLCIKIEMLAGLSGRTNAKAPLKRVWRKYNG
jgi:hypothetical protein